MVGWLMPLPYNIQIRIIIHSKLTKVIHVSVICFFVVCGLDIYKFIVPEESWDWPKLS